MLHDGGTLVYTDATEEYVLHAFDSNLLRATIPSSTEALLMLVSRIDTMEAPFNPLGGEGTPSAQDGLGLAF